MGKYVTSVASTTVSLIEDTPDIIKQSVMASIRNNTNIADDLMNTVTNTYAQKVSRAYRYARDKYYLGLPNGTLGHLAVDENAVRSVLDDIVDVPVGGSYSILSAELDTMLTASFANEAYQFGVGDMKFNYFTGLVSNVTVFGNDPTVPLIMHLPVHSAEIISPTILKVYFQYSKYIPAHGNGDNYTPGHSLIWKGTHRVNILHSDYNRLINNHKDYYYYVVYQIKDADGHPVGNPILWNYWENSGKYPALDYEDAILSVNQYMPVIPIRQHNNMLFDTEAEKETAAYKTSKELLNLLELDIDELTEGVAANPDIGQVDHAYVTIGVNLFTNKKESLAYLYEFAKYMHSSSPTTSGNYISISDGSYSVLLRWDDTRFSQIRGSIGKVGTIRKWISLGDTDKFIIQKQDSELYIHEYQIDDIVLINRIYGTSKSVRTALDAHGNDQEALCVPLNISIVETKLSPLEANVVYYDALRILFNSFERTKLKWYQRGIFKIVTLVIAVAIAVYTGGIGAVVFAFIGGIVVDLTLSLLVKLGTKLFGQHGGKIFAALAVVAAVVVGVMTGFIPPDITMLLNLGLQVGTSLVDKFTNLDLKDIQSEASVFGEEVKHKEAILEEAQAKLDHANEIDPFGIYESVGMIPNLSIDQYMYTKLELPITAGQASLDIVHNWVDTQLTLPSFN